MSSVGVKGAESGGKRPPDSASITHTPSTSDTCETHVQPVEKSISPCFPLI
jgi:hypothetical protein